MEQESSKTKIFYLGGASASGKSTTATILASEYSLPIFELDHIKNALTEAHLDEPVTIEIAQRLCSQLVKECFTSGVSCIIEGGWITTIMAKELCAVYNTSFIPVYCGYTGLDIKRRFKLIKSGKQHWLRKKSRDDAARFMEKQIHYSGACKSQCEEYKFPYVDCTNFDEGQFAIKEHFKKAFIDR